MDAKVGQQAAAPRQRRRMWSARLLPVLLLVGLLAVALVKCWLLTQGLGADGRSTYTWARWQYGEGSRFDNSWPTWATDYGLCALTGVQAARIRSGDDSELRSRAWVLPLMYSASTCLGGLAHQLHDGTPDGLNTGAFRLVWTLVVGLTAAAGGVLGLIGTELLRLGRERPTVPGPARRAPVGGPAPAPEAVGEARPVPPPEGQRHGGCSARHRPMRASASCHRRGAGHHVDLLDSRPGSRRGGRGVLLHAAGV